jgi:hypothetical protein
LKNGHQQQSDHASPHECLQHSRMRTENIYNSLQSYTLHTSGNSARDWDSLQVNDCIDTTLVMVTLIHSL